jgi:hypothetical protein
VAERRMFTKKVTDDDNFMSLSSSAQALYLHLSMSADDDGFCNQVSLSMFKAHASVQDLQALLEKRYIYQFDNGVIVIKHWRMANALRKDRYTPTAFQEELAKLDLKDNGSYTWLPSGCHEVAGCLPQDSIGKNSIGKNNIYSVHFEKAWSVYLKKRDKAAAYKAYNARLNDGYSEDELYLATVKYMEECKKEKREEKYIKNASTFYGPNTPFVDYLPKGGTGNYSKSMEYGRKIYQGDESRTAPYFGFPPEWFEGEQLIEERITPLVCDKSYVQGGREDYEFTVEELKGIYESRKRGKQYEQCFDDIFDS